MPRRRGTLTEDDAEVHIDRLEVDLPAAKAAMRARIRAQRRTHTPEQRREDAVALSRVVLELPEVQTAHCVAVYASMPSEPGTTPMRTALAAAGLKVLLPIVLRDGRLDWAEDRGPLRPVRGLGGPEPTGPRLGLTAIRQAEVLLIPALAVDTLGHRLGQGAGYYDRVLAMVSPSVPVIAIVHEGEVLDAAVEPVPVEVHDRGVDAVVTPRRCLRIR